jgi:hypothetical protein
MNRVDIKSGLSPGLAKNYASSFSMKYALLVVYPEGGVQRYPSGLWGGLTVLFAA